MRKIVACILLMLCVSFLGKAQRYTNGSAPMVSIGVEWGVPMTVFDNYHYNYLCEEGYRLDEVGADWAFKFNQYALIFLGANIFNKVNVGFASGIEGLDGRRMIPLLSRLSFYPYGLASDGLFVHGAAGPLFEVGKTGINGSMETIGTGYRFSLSRAISLDLGANVEVFQSKTELHDPDTGNTISERDTRRNSIGYYALNLSIALVF